MSAVTDTMAEKVEGWEETDLVRVYVWDRVVRITHWLIVLSILVLSATGIYIGAPFIPTTGPPGDHFLMGTVRIVHFYAAIVFTLAVGVRIVWMFTGPSFAKWWNFIPVHVERLQGAFRMLWFYLCIRTFPPVNVGHNPLAGMAYSVVFLLYIVMILTGWALYGMSAHVESPLRGFASFLFLFGGAQGARWIHHVGMWFLIFFTIHHVYSAVLISIIEKNGTMESIFSGNKWFRKGAFGR